MLVAQSCLTLCNPMDCSPPGSSIHGINSPDKNTGVGCHSLLQGVFPTQGLNWGIPLCRQILWVTREAYGVEREKILNNFCGNLVFLLFFSLLEGKARSNIECKMPRDDKEQTDKPFCQEEARQKRKTVTSTKMSLWMSWTNSEDF